MPLKPYACANCGHWQRYFGPPPHCPVCTDVRNDLPEDGWQWVTPDEADARLTCSWRDVADGIVEFSCSPPFGLAGCGWLLRYPEGNVAFEGAPFYSEAALTRIEELGGIAVLSGSHPHGYGAIYQLQDRFQPLLPLHKDALPFSKAWRVNWPFDDTFEIRPGLTIHYVGGHYEGQCVLHDAPRRTLFCGDALKIDLDAEGRARGISCHKAFHKQIPLSHGEVRVYRRVFERLDFDTVATPFELAHGVTTADALRLFDRQLEGQPFAQPMELGR